MKTISKILTSLLLLALMLAPAMSASAQGLHSSLAEGRVILGDNFVLAEGQTLNGDLVVIGGNVTIQKNAAVKGSMAVIGGNVSVAEGAHIDGDAALIGGNLDLGGALDGDLALIGGDAALSHTALVDGDISTVGGNIKQDEGAQVTGNIVTDIETPSVLLPDSPGDLALSDPRPGAEINLNPFWDFFGSVGQAFVTAIIMAGIAVLASLFLQPQMEHVGGSIVSQPLVAGGFGLLTLVLGVFALLILALTLILSPAAALGLIALALAWMFGLIAMGQELGERFAQAFHLSWNVPLVAGAGTFMLALAVSLLGLFPCLGFLLQSLVGLMGLGGVALTVLNSRRPAVIPATVSTTEGPIPPVS
jgi:carbonic anhydrase/acetyltransferase-like protein (isoleucine patch superfamily)